MSYICKDEVVLARLEEVAKMSSKYFPKPTDNRKSLMRYPRWRSAMHVYTHWAKDYMYMRQQDSLTSNNQQ